MDPYRTEIEARRTLLICIPTHEMFIILYLVMLIPLKIYFSKKNLLRS